MGRPERPVDPDAGPVQRFASELRALRREAGSPSYRVMAQRARFSVTALSRAASGERLPSSAVVRAYAQACGADPDAWEGRWRAAADESVACEGQEGESPYQGLARFEPGDRELFFGRERLVDDTLDLVKEHRFAVVLGASGSGKSSLLRAGLMPRLESIVRERGCDARLRLITPGARPSATHGALLAPRRDGPERWLVVDQFEEIFTLCRNRADRWRFVDLLLAAREASAGLRVVVAVGGNFYGRCTEHPELAEALRHHSLIVRPMCRAELREAVVRPASAAGLRVERELTARIVEEVADRPGALPMLSHALRETWRRRRGGVLTLAGYEATGGVHGAIAAAAEEVYGRLSPAQARTARLLLLALITPGDGTPDTRRPVRRAELREWPDPEVPEVLERLARARLVTLDEENVELAHEALITGWPRLQEWIEENRERLRQHRHLTEAARIWQEHGRDSGTLYRGLRLAVADALFTRDRHDDDLTATERAFLSASRVDHSMERWTAARMRRLTRGLVLALSVVVAGALTAGQAAWEQSDTADLEHTRAVARQAAALAGRAGPTDPRASALLSIAAWRLAPLPESRAALLDALAAPERDTFTAPVPGDGTPVFLTDSGRTLLSAGGGRWTTWDVTTHHRTGSGRLPDLPVTAVSPDGRTLALADTTEQRLWRRSGGRVPDASGPVLDFGSGGRSYVVGGRNGGSGEVERNGGGGAQLRALADGRVLFERRTAGDTRLIPGADDRLVAVCRADGPLTLWDTTRHRELRGAWRTAGAPDCSATTPVFSPDGARLAAVLPTGTRVWDTASGRQLAHLTGPNDVRHLAFTADGTFLATATRTQATVWRLPTPHSSGGGVGSGGEGADAGTGLGIAGAGDAGTGLGIAGAGDAGTGLGIAGAGDAGTGLGIAGAGDAGTGLGIAGAGDAGTGLGIAGAGDAGTGLGIAGAGDAGTGLGIAGAGGAGTAPDTAGTADTRPASGTAGTRPASDTTPATPVFRHPLTDAPVAALAWDPATPTLRYLSAGTVHSLDLTAPLTSGWLARPAALQLLSPDGRLLATAERTADGYRFHLRDTRTGHIVAEPPPVSVARADRPLMTFSPEGEAFAYGATGFRDASPDPAPFAVWDVPGHRQRAALALDGPPASGVRSIALTPGGRDLLVSRATAAGPLTGEVWNTAHGTRTTEPKALAAALGGALSAGFTGRAAALPFGWDSEVPLADGDRPDVLALSPDRTHLATGGAFGTVTVWEGTRDRHRAAVLPAAPVAPDCASCARVTALAFSPDGRTLAVGHASGALRLWDTATWQPLGGSLNTPGDALRSLAFSADGTSVHASGAHVPVQTYALDPARVVAQLCARAGTTLTRAEWHTYLPEVPYLRLCEQPPASEDADSDTDSDSDPAPAPAPVTASPDARERSVRESAVREGAVPGPAVPETAAPETSPPDRHAPSTETPSATPRRPKGETDLRAPDKTRRPASGNRDRHSEARRLFTPLTCIAQQFRAPECGR